MFEQHCVGICGLQFVPSAWQTWGVAVGVGVGTSAGSVVGVACACCTMRIVASFDVEAGGLPLSVQLKRVVKL